MKFTVTAFALAAALFTAGTNANDLRQVFKYNTTYVLSPYNACEAWRCSCVNCIPRDYSEYNTMQMQCSSISAALMLIAQSTHTLRFFFSFNPS